jgi:hypothetical protein
MDPGQGPGSGINAWSTAGVFSPCADRPSYVRLRGRRE